LEIFGYLKSQGIAANESEFSEHWLGASESYMRKLRSAGSEPSLGVVAICASRLMNAAEQLGSIPHCKQIADDLASMSGRCRSLVDAGSVEFDFA